MGEPCGVYCVPLKVFCRRSSVSGKRWELIQNMTGAFGYIYSRLDEYGQDYIEELIPHEYVQGKNNEALMNSYGPWFCLVFSIR